MAEKAQRLNWNRKEGRRDSGMGSVAEEKVGDCNEEVWVRMRLGVEEVGVRVENPTGHLLQSGAAEKCNFHCCHFRNSLTNTPPLEEDFPDSTANDRIIPGPILGLWCLL